MALKNDMSVDRVLVGGRVVFLPLIMPIGPPAYAAGAA
jgi:hypothetical protein